MRIVVASTYVPFRDGGGARVADDLARELAARGRQTDTVLIPFSSAGPNVTQQTLALRLLDLSESSGERIDRLIALDSSACALRHPHKAAWLIDRMPGDCDTRGGTSGDDAGRPRETPRPCDGLYLRECRTVFAPSRAAADRLKQLHHLDAAGVLRPPLPRHAAFRPGPFGDYLFQPGPIQAAQRQALAVEAMRRARPEVRLVIGGAADEPPYLDGLRDKVREHGLNGRIEFTGPLSEEQTAEWMSGCRGVLDPACGEHGCASAALEAFQSGKPVVTLTDCGGAELVEDGVNGLAAAPEARALAAAMDRLWADPAEARRMGDAARETPARRRIDWDHVIESLIS